MELDKVEYTLAKYEKDVLTLPGVVGISTGILKGKIKEMCIKVYLNRAIPRGDLINRHLPEVLDGVPVEAIITGNIVAF